MTHLIFQYLVASRFVTSGDRLSNNTIIHAHCVAATRMDGPQGPRPPTSSAATWKTTRRVLQ